ncbi:hypothetical protein GY21_20805 [Cryobacterium roopkundense]|uniref:DNA primase/nucleoside triphosphatase C-terminal domain-containing protein n=1 Tax=Cryobacterium roopkundense TaxID=1001240 RepID=A0A099J2A1_9MICO|nr:primase-like DNA-binding domain-containing protein [Cryobacterium roopkundense]KGJ71637.1 hypothetical protein GY21_20805 [Cryobacterium roopkundense]MBB5643525.1 hypothetical protein [Cryobacterium roopkundense]
MHNTEQTLGTAIAELNCLSPGAPATLGELNALNVARDCIDELLRSCVSQLRAEAATRHSWGAIAHVLDASPRGTQQKYSPALVTAVSGAGLLLDLHRPVLAPALGHDHDDQTQLEHRLDLVVHANDRISAFWKEFAPRFAWDFLPTEFLHALYVEWMTTEVVGEEPLGKAAFTGRLTKIVSAESVISEPVSVGNASTQAAAPDGWRYTRARAQRLMRAAESMADQLHGWSPDSSGNAIYGLHRNTRRQPSRAGR